MSRLKDQVVFVTGATGGIGGATARRLAAEGAKLAVSGRDAQRVEALAHELGNGALPVTADVADEATVREAIGQAGEHFGGLDALVNVPGLSVPGPIAEMAVEDFAKTFDVNVKGMFLCSKHFLGCVDSDRGGLILNISSMAGRNANPNAPVYCAAKAATNMLASGLSLQAKQANVRVSVVSPGPVSTSGFWGDRPVPHEKFLQPEDVADVIAYLIGLPSHVVVHDVALDPWEFYKSK